MKSFAERTHYTRLQNGMDVYALPTSTRDVVVATVSLAGGTFAVREQTIALLRSDLVLGSTRGRSRTHLRERIASLGASVQVNVDNRYTTLQISCLKDSFTDVMQLLVETLLTPQFPKVEFAEAQSRLAANLQHSEEDTATQAQLALLQAFYKKGHPHYARPLKEVRKAASTVTQQDVRAFHKAHTGGTGSHCVVTGDMQAGKLIAALTRILESLPTKDMHEASILHIDKTRIPPEGDRVVSMKDRMNIDVILGTPVAITAQHEDFLPLTLGVAVLGAGATGRMFKALRVKNNLSYGAYASLTDFQDRLPGRIEAHAILPNDVYIQGRDIFRMEFEQWALRGVLASELKEQKQATIGSFAVGLSTTRGQHAALVNTIHHGRPLRYIDEYAGRIQDLSRAQVNRAITEHVHTDLTVLAAAGSIDAKGAAL